jgi:hypothetical protein
MTAITKEQLARSASRAAEYRQAGYGPGTPTAERRKTAIEMHSRGVTLADIARVFEVTPEAARHWIRGRRPVYLTDDEIDLVMKYRAKMRRFRP